MSTKLQQQIVIHLFFTVILCLTTNHLLWSQNKSPQITFSQNPKDNYALDTQSKFLLTQKQLNNSPSKKLLFYHYKYLPNNQRGFVNFKAITKDSLDLRLFKVFINNTQQNLPITPINEDTFEIELPAANQDYKADIYYNLQPIEQLTVVTHPKVKRSITVVPINNHTFNKTQLEQELNSLCNPFNVEFNVQLQKPFFVKDLKSLSNPSLLREKYTLEMREIRDAYFQKNPNISKSAPIVFVVPKFNNNTITEFGVSNKSLGFVSQKNIPLNILRFYLTGPLAQNYINEEFKDNATITNHLLNQKPGDNLFYQHWKSLQQKKLILSFNDDYERVLTNNGLVAYYFWKTNSKGNIVIQEGDFLKTIQRFFKKNTYSYHLEINFILYKTIYEFKDYRVNSLHVISVLMVIIFWTWLSFKIRIWLKQNYKWSGLFRLMILLLQWILIGISIYATVLLVNYGYRLFEVKKGEIQEYQYKTPAQVKQLLADNNNPYLLNEKNICSEIITNHQNNYYLHQRDAVLYFHAKSFHGKIIQLSLSHTSNKLTLPNLGIHEPAKSHYIVLNEVDEYNHLQTKIYNHLGIDITKKIKLKDPAKRILVFVNGYRPTSTSNTIEENIYDIQNNGLEFPDTYNQLFNYDRYNYWHPWNAIDDLFKNRINPYDVYYADGHHSVATSNHQSLVNFTSLTANYPKRCTNQNQHSCYKNPKIDANLFEDKFIDTYQLLPTKPNKEGFEKRKYNGKLAGKNLFQLLNERPNFSKNDTLYLVSHSMGYAYALGIVEELRNHIQLGAFYTIAPENATSGQINLKEWKQAYQYGSLLNKNQKDAPCLQDGVAPQSCAKGLTEKNRIYIPQNKYHLKGFLNSHFIGHYTWIFDIPKNQKGFVKYH